MRKIIHIRVKETVIRNVGLVIGDDIDQDEADRLLGMEADEADIDSAEYEVLSHYLGDDICDSEGFHDIEIYEQNKNN